MHTNAFGGTSAATLIVAGVAALIRTACPQLTDSEVKQILCNTADKIGSPYDPATGRSTGFGYGRVNSARVLAACTTPPPAAKKSAKKVKKVPKHVAPFPRKKATPKK